MIQLGTQVPLTLFVYHVFRGSVMLTTREQWSWLRDIFPKNNYVTVTDTQLGNGLVVTETYKGVPIFRYVRYFDGSRTTQVNLLGFVGISSVRSRRCLLTEGVSDFLSLYSHTNPQLWSVVGRTSLRLTAKHADVLAALFDEVVVIGDNDSTGMAVFGSHLTLLSERGVRVGLVTSVRKDITTDLYCKDLTALSSL